MVNDLRIEPTIRFPYHPFPSVRVLPVDKVREGKKSACGERGMETNLDQILNFEQ